MSFVVYNKLPVCFFRGQMVNLLVNFMLGGLWPTISVTFCYWQSNIHTFFTPWLVSCEEVQKEPGGEPFSSSLLAFLAQLFLSMFMWKTKCEIINVIQERVSENLSWNILTTTGCVICHVMLCMVPRGWIVKTLVILWPLAPSSQNFNFSSTSIYYSIPAELTTCPCYTLCSVLINNC